MADDTKLVAEERAIVAYVALLQASRECRALFDAAGMQLPPRLAKWFSDSPRKGQLWAQGEEPAP